MEKINIVELLKECPEGMELDCTIYDDVTFKCIVDKNCYPIQAQTPEGNILLSQYGCMSLSTHSKCVIFPKGKTTWEGFVPPCKFKEGDIIADEHGNIAIYKGEMRHNKKLADYYCGYRNADGKFLVKKDIEGHFGHIEEKHLATEEEKAELFDAIKANGYKWNEETKTLEKLIEPKFKVGDRIRRKNSNEEYIITSINDYTYYYRLNEHCTGSLGIQLQDEYELVPDKFDINTLVAFDSRVLIRDTKSQKWSPAIWGFYDSDHQDYQYKLVGVIARYCIPYEGNEHLLGKTDDCDEYFKTWK
jgi:hypothetical protein